MTRTKNMFLWNLDTKKKNEGKLYTDMKRFHVAKCKKQTREQINIFRYFLNVYVYTYRNTQRDGWQELLQIFDGI